MIKPSKNKNDRRNYTLIIKINIIRIQDHKIHNKKDSQDEIVVDQGQQKVIDLKRIFDQLFKHFILKIDKSITHMNNKG